MMHLILAESELELIPSKIRNHPSVKSSKNHILDSSLHHTAMTDLDHWRRRGRPDIVHIFLLLANESILNKEGLLRTYIHTRNNEIININPKTRIIKNYDRFKGLLYQLAIHKRIPIHGEKLMEIRRGSVDKILREIDCKKILFSPKGKKMTFEDIMEEEITCVIGGFPSGDFTKPIHNFVDEVVSIYNAMLPAWVVSMEAIIAYENKFIRGKV